MEDLERYGDYNDTEDDAPRGKSPVLLILKILIFTVCIAVVFVLGFRIILFNHYPSSIKDLYYNDVLRQHYSDSGNDINVLTQSLRAPYDHADEGNFFCDNLYVIREAGQLQVSVRFNVSLVDSIKEKYGVEIDPNDPDIFSFSLARNPGGEGEAIESIGKLTYVKNESSMMYRYFKLVFDDVDFGDGEDSVNWIRLEINIEGVEREEPFMVAIYENHEDYSSFDEFEEAAPQ